MPEKLNEGDTIMMQGQVTRIGIDGHVLAT